MKELQEIVLAWEAQRRQGQTAALATVVRVDGSAYRRPGARMLVGADGTVVGSVSGGCLEADVVARAQRVLETGDCTLVTYDTTDDADAVFGVGLGCRGVVRILIERLTPADDAAVSLAAGLLRARAAGVLATVIGESGGGVVTGDRFLRTATGHGTGPAALQAAARRVWEAGFSMPRTVAVPGGWAEVFFEVIRPPRPLVIFGAGQDAPPLARLARELGWHVTVADHRHALATHGRFPETDVVLISPQGDLPPSLRLDEHTAVVVMTHNIERDRALLAALLPTPVAYLGVLGPKRRTEKLLADLRADGMGITDLMLSRLHSPIGLDIGGETPEQIALSIVAEIQAAAAGRMGGFLRDRCGPIYDRPDEEVPWPVSA